MSFDLKQRRTIKHENATDHLLAGNEEENKEEIKRNKTDELKKSDEESPLSLTNILWLLLAVVVVYYSDIFSVILFEQKINRYFFLIKTNFHIFDILLSFV
jgi:hypothetical protein